MTNGYRLVREPKGKEQTRRFLQDWAIRYGDTYHTWSGFKRSYHVVPVGDGINIKVRKTRTDKGLLRKSRQIAMKDYAVQNIPARPKKQPFWKKFWYRFGNAMIFVFVFINIMNLTLVFGTPTWVHAGEGIFDAKVSEPHQTPFNDTGEVRYLFDTEIVAMIRKYFKNDTDWALKCLQSENGRHNLKAVNHNRNGSTDRGLFQINSVHCGKVGGDCSKLFDLETNVRVAKKIFDTQGKGAWYGKTCR